MIIIIVILALNLFVFLNFKIFNKRMAHIKEAKTACDGLELDNKCEYVFRGNVTEGVCKEVKKKILVCKDLGENNGS